MNSRNYIITGTIKASINIVLLTLLELHPGIQKFEETPAYSSAVLTPNKPWPVEVKSHAAQGETLTIPSFTMPQIAPGSSTPSVSSNSSCSTVRKALKKYKSDVLYASPIRIWRWYFCVSSPVSMLVTRPAYLYPYCTVYFYPMLFV